MKNTLRAIAVLAVTGALSGGCLALVNRMAAPRVEAHRARELREAVLAVVPGGERFESWEHEGEPCYRVFDDRDRLIGYSTAGSGLGYGGEIRLMIGLSADRRHLAGLRLLENIETPGLGGRISEPGFTSSFAGLPVYRHETTLGRPGDDRPRVEAITGATVSSQAVVDIVNRAVARLRAAAESDEKNK